MSRLAVLASAAVLAGLAPTTGLAAEPPDAAAAQPVALDAETVVGGVPVACTGVGQTRADPKWAAYPVRVEFSDAQNQYLTGAVVTLSDGRGRPLLSVRCDGPWLLLRPPPGRYAVSARLMDSAAAPRSARISPPARGQTRVVLQFPDA